MFESRIRFKISFKIFLVTSVIFTTLLVGGLFAQSYFYQKTYVVYKQSEFSNAFSQLCRKLSAESLTQEEIYKWLEEYKQRYQMLCVVYQKNSVSEDYEIEGFYRYDFYGADEKTMLAKAFAEHRFAVDEFIVKGNSFGGDYIYSETGEQYSILIAQPRKATGAPVLFSMAPYDEEYNQVRSLVDRYSVYIVFIGILFSLVLSYVFSSLISRPLIKINNAAKNMAQLKFDKKIEITSHDELGELSESLNTLSEGLDSTLQELTEVNKKLMEDIEKERTLEKIRKEFVANVSHELKTPLAIIKGYSEALKDNVREDKRERYLNKIVQEIDDMNKLVQDMLDLSRIEAGRYKPDMTSFDLIMLSERIVENLEFLMDEKNLILTYTHSADELYMYADRLKIGQVIVNFVSNAINYTPVGGRIFLSINDSDGSILFEIENEGKAIDVQKLHRVWDRFYREEEARNKKTGGTGLGLAISSKILEMHGIEYGVENTDIGVKFYFKAKKDL